MTRLVEAGGEGVPLAEVEAVAAAVGASLPYLLLRLESIPPMLRSLPPSLPCVPLRITLPYMWAGG